MTEIRTHHVTENYIEIDRPIKLETTSRTFRFFLPSFYEDEMGNRHLRGKFMYQRKGASGWEDGDGLSLKDVKAGEAVSFELKSEAMNNFLNGISVLLKTAEIASLDERAKRFSVESRDRVIEINDETLKPVVEGLINKGYSGAF